MGITGVLGALVYWTMSSKEVPESQIFLSNFSYIKTAELTGNFDEPNATTMGTIDGEMKTFNNCLEVLEQDLSQIRSPEYYYFKDLKNECKALEIYVQGQRIVKRTWAYLSLGDLISQKTLPKLSDSAPDFQDTLVPGPFEINSLIEAKLDFDGLYLFYRVLARGGFQPSKSDSENLLVIMDWAILGASGKGSHLFILEKSDSGPAHLIPVNVN